MPSSDHLKSSIHLVFNGTLDSKPSLQEYERVVPTENAVSEFVTRVPSTMVAVGRPHSKSIQV